jgi:hypothetical protein
MIEQEHRLAAALAEESLRMVSILTQLNSHTHVSVTVRD